MGLACRLDYKMFADERNSISGGGFQAQKPGNARQMAIYVALFRTKRSPWPRVIGGPIRSKVIIEVWREHHNWLGPKLHFDVAQLVHFLNVELPATCKTRYIIVIHA